MKLTTREQLFYDNAGYSYNPDTQTPEDGRRETARRLAAAELWAMDAGINFDWSIDPYADSSEFDDDPDPWQLWQCCAYQSDGGIVASLHAIDFGRDKGPHGSTYSRVVQAELAVEAMDNEPQYAE